MFLKQRGFKALLITKGFNFSPAALHANIIVKRSLEFLTPLAIEDHTDKWEKNLIESHLLCFIPLLEQRAL
jgi:hypothetical protein